MAVETRELAGSVVAITGATSGIGRATARALVARGALVAVTGRRRDRIEEVREELGDAHVLGVAGDARDPDLSRELVSQTLDRFGRIDSLVVSAGIGAYGGILDGTDDDLTTMIETNFSATVWNVRAAVPHMLATGGDIVIVASVAGLRGGANEAVYAATKFAQIGLAGAVDRELRTSGIRVTAICPAAVSTEFALGHGRTEGDPWLDDVLRPEDVAAAVVTVLEQPRRMRTTMWSMWAATEAS